MEWLSAFKTTGIVAGALIAVGTLFGSLGLMPATKTEIVELKGEVSELKREVTAQGKQNSALRERVDLIYDILKTQRQSQGRR